MALQAPLLKENNLFFMMNSGTAVGPLASALQLFCVSSVSAHPPIQQKR